MQDYIEINYVDVKYKKCNKNKKNNVKDKKKKEKLTDNVITPYEYARLLSAEAKQIAAGMPFSVKWDGPFDPIGIAKKVIEQSAGILVIIRKIPDGSIQGFEEEVWDLKHLDIRDI
jgi:DNA-directed RNA polymerase subunit K/omega